jgi:hypothetical protein
MSSSLKSGFWNDASYSGTNEQPYTTAGENLPRAWAFIAH